MILILVLVEILLHVQSYKHLQTLHLPPYAPQNPQEYWISLPVDRKNDMKLQARLVGGQFPASTGLGVDNQDIQRVWTTIELMDCSLYGYNGHPFTEMAPRTFYTLPAKAMAVGDEGNHLYSIPPHPPVFIMNYRFIVIRHAHPHRSVKLTLQYNSRKSDKFVLMKSIDIGTALGQAYINV